MGCSLHSRARMGTGGTKLVPIVRYTTSLSPILCGKFVPCCVQDNNVGALAQSFPSGVVENVFVASLVVAPFEHTPQISMP